MEKCLEFATLKRGAISLYLGVRPRKEGILAQSNSLNGTTTVCAMLSATAEIFVGSPCVIVKVGLTFFENKVLIQSCWLCFWHILCTLNLFHPWGLFAKLTVKSVDGLGENNNIYAFVTIAINTKYLLHIEHVLHSVHRRRRIIE